MVIYNMMHKLTLITYLIIWGTFDYLGYSFAPHLFRLGWLKLNLASVVEISFDKVVGH